MTGDWPIIILTLPGAESRRAGLEQALAAEGLDWRLHFGVDGRNGLPPACEVLVDRRAAQRKLGREMTDGELACALSHRAIYDTIVSNGLPGAIVLEDDARPEPGFYGILRNERFKQVPMTLFHYWYGRAVRGRKLALQEGFVLRRAAMRATSTMAYAVRADAARHLLTCTTPVSYQADWPCDLYLANAWLCVPKVCHEAKGNVSHLADARNGLADRSVQPESHRSFPTWLRQRLSVRVGRQKGQR